MSSRIRGQEQTVRFLVEGQPVAGSWMKVKDFDAKPRTDIKETDFGGEAQTDLDIQHHGYDCDFTIHNLDPQAVDFLDELARREENHEEPQDVQVQVRYDYRDGATPSRMVTYFDGHLKVDSEGWRDRKEYVETKFSGKYKHRRTITVPRPAAA